MRPDATTRAVTTADGRLTIEGERNVFVQSPARHLLLETGPLDVVSGYASQNGSLGSVARLRGFGSLGRDWLGRAGFADRAQHVALSIRALPESGDGKMLLRLGFDDEADAPHAGAFLADLFVSASVYTELKRDLQAGLVDTVSISAATNLWISDADRDPPAGGPVTWYLGIEADGRTSDSAKGLVQSLSWSQRGRGQEEPRPVLAPSPPSGAADDDLEDGIEFRKLRQMTVLNRWMMNLLIALIAIMFVLALK